MKSWKKNFLLFVWVFISACGASPAKPRPSLPLPPTASNDDGTEPMQTVLKDLAYANVSAAEKLDLYVPSGEGPFATVLYFHGGAFANGDKDTNRIQAIIAHLLKAGYAVASMNYRESGEAIFPAQIHDAKAAVRWLRANAATYRLDAKRIAAWGDSSGANNVALLGTSCGDAFLEGGELGNSNQSSCVQAVVDFYGPINFLSMDQESIANSCNPMHDHANSPESRYMGAPIQSIPELVAKADPTSYLSADDPAFFIQHGTADCTVPYQQSETFHEALLDTVGNGKLSYQLFDGAKHGDPLFYTEANFDLVVQFLEAHL